MKIIVAQIGARHHYAIPRMLANKGCLEALYTDASANRGFGRMCDALLPVTMRRGRIKTLLERRIRGVAKKQVRCTDRLLWQKVVTRWTDPDALGAQFKEGVLFGRAMQQWGFGNATGVYSMFGEGLEFLKAAKIQGLRVAVDVFITPIAHRIVSDERRSHPAWEGTNCETDERSEPRIREVLELADLLLCPGQNVVDGVKFFGEALVQKCRIVPYGSGIDFNGRRNEPIPGRVLFGGTAELRKGIHYFAAAAQQLRASGINADFRVAGNATESIRTQPACSALRFLGRIPRDTMQEEMLRADVLVLPTLAEGSASVIAEALAAGLPAITTPSAGSIIIHDQSGILVPERNSSELAAAISGLIADRSKRRYLARGAYEAASYLHESAWASRLMAALAS